MSLREYGRHRGVSAPSVLRAIRSGRLKACLVTGADGKQKVGDVAVADLEWTANTDLSKAPGYVKERAAPRTAAVVVALAASAPLPGTDAETAVAIGSMTLSAASALEKEWRAKLAELDYQRKAGDLVVAADVESRLVDVFTRCKTKLLGLPSRAKSALPHLTAADVLLIDGLVREALEDLAVLPVATDGTVAA